MEAGRTAFVTGGSGFLGGALIRRLSGDGWRVRALARSERSGSAVAEAGAEPVQGDLDAMEQMRAGAEGCEVAFHAAASVADWGPWKEFERVNVHGTRNVIEACRLGGVRRLVHVGTEAALVAGQPLVMADETAPLRPDSKAYYCASKALAEQAVLDASEDGPERVVVRPRLVWGPGDTTVLPALVELVERGRFAWVGGGTYRTSTTHVDNAVEGLVLAAGSGRPGQAYFVSDGEPVVFREFITDLLATQGVEPPSRTVPLRVARAVAAAGEGAWRLLRLRGAPPLTRGAVWLSSQEMTVDTAKARAELGYEPVVSVAEGLRRLREASQGVPG